jgi:hypothetical protein
MLTRTPRNDGCRFCGMQGSALYVSGKHRKYLLINGCQMILASRFALDNRGVVG